MGEKCILDIQENGVAVLKISNPPMNAFDEPTLREFESLMKGIAGDGRVKVVVITGDNDLFVVGADVNKVREVNTREEGERVTGEAQGIINLVENSRKPVIAAINGLCLGGGTELALACHMRIASDQAQMGLPEIMLGIIPAFGGTQRSARLLGTARALEIMLTGKFIPMAEAERIGLVNRVVPKDELMNDTLKFAGSIAKKGQLAVRAIVEAVMEGVKLPIEEGLKLESRCFGRIAASEDKEEGIAAFLEKRKPVFKDR